MLLSCLFCSGTVQRFHAWCEKCDGQLVANKNSHVLLEANEISQELVVALKKGTNDFVHKYCIGLLIQKIKSRFVSDHDCIVCLPSTPYVQTILFGGMGLCTREVARALNMSACVDLLVKKVPHKQSELSLKERIDSAVFWELTESHKQIRGKSIVLLDDVMTTGVSLFQAKLTLLNAGAKKVSVLTIISRALQMEG